MNVRRNLRVRDIRGLIESRLWAQILVAMVVGVGVGLLLSPQTEGPFSLEAGTAEDVAEWLRLPGQIFLNVIQMVVIPLIISSIILGLTSAGDPAFLRKVGFRIAPYFVGTTTLAVLLGAAVASLIKPGRFIDGANFTDAAMAEAAGSVDALMTEPAEVLSAPAQIANLVPASIDNAMLTGNMLQIVVYALFIGVAMSIIGPDRSEPLSRLLQTVQEVAMKIIGWAMRLAPIAVLGLISDFVIRAGFDALIGLSAYIVSVLIGLAALLTCYLVIVLVLGRRNPFAFAGKIVDAQLLAFSTSSSAATMPLSLRVAEDRLKVAPPIARFVIPLGATVNMDGTALYQVVAALFIAQLFGVDLSAAQFALLVITVVGASIGSPSTPGVGIIILATILQGMGIPAAGVAILLGVDRILDMCRTAVNVTGDLTACVVMDRWLEDVKADPLTTPELTDPPAS
ncbi:dicarboxylate/amino acid:cation symporter [Oceanicaulis alexandrii]|uniref:dicarboxylate/amino acid:cation symporter n=1 Tax=Oceanicaulis alexandrii TaxID=153233 RepID=UPI0003B79950|nr:dicarboxylate/amino acid:cation symporter [Oceanicaulis alexandrii]